MLFIHCPIAAAAMFGLPDDFYGEQVAARIRLHAGQTVTEEEVRACCKEQIAHFKIPAYIHFVSGLPMTVPGKLQKFQMREEEIGATQTA